MKGASSPSQKAIHKGTPRIMKSSVSMKKKDNGDKGFSQLKTLNTQLCDVVIRRKYIDAYFQSLNPITLFGTHKLNVNSFDTLSTDTRHLQYNIILASSLRSFGAPPSVYTVFAAKATKMASYLHTDFTFESALGFHFLAFYYWGEDPLLAAHYRDVAQSMCKCALLKEHSPQENAILCYLRIFSIGVDRTNTQFYDIEDELHSIVPDFVGRRDATLNQIIIWAKLHFLMDNYLLVDPETGAVPRKFEPGTFDCIVEVLNAVVSHFQNHLQCFISKEIVHSMASLIRSLIFYHGGFIAEAFLCMRGVLDNLEGHSYLLRMGGPQFVDVFHSLFVVAFRENRFEIASRINSLQNVQADMFPAGKRLALDDKTLLESVLL